MAGSSLLTLMDRLALEVLPETSNISTGSIGMVNKVRFYWEDSVQLICCSDAMFELQMPERRSWDRDHLQTPASILMVAFVGWEISMS